MKTDTTKAAGAVADEKLFDNWFDPVETSLRVTVRGFIETMIEEELDTALSRPRYGRRLELTAADNAAAPIVGHRHGHRMRSLTGTFGPTQIAVPRARIIGEDGKTAEWKSKSLRAYQRRILDGTVVRARLDKKATSISLLVAMGVRQDGPKVLRAVKNMGGESEAAGRALLDDLVHRGRKTPELVIVDGAAGLEKALTALWSDMPVQRCTVPKHRNLLVHAPGRLHAEISADYNDMIYADSKPEIEARRKAFIRKWRLKCRAVADSVEEAGDKLFTFTRFPKSQGKSIRTSNAIERLHEEFKRRIKTQTVLPSAETAAMLFWALLASGQITMRKVDGWRSLAEKPSDQIIDLAA
jgi:transposase-like protein